MKGFYMQNSTSCSRWASATIVLQARQSAMTLIALAATLLALGALPTHGKPSNNSIDAIPTVTSIVFQNGQLLASGNVTAVIKGKTFTKSFTGVPVLIRL